MALKTLDTLVTDEQVGRADKIVQSLTGQSRSQLKGLFDHDCVQVNGVVCKNPGQTLNAGEKVLVKFDPHTRYKEKKSSWSDRTFTLIHEDDDIIVVDKSAGVLTVATKKGEANTLEDRVGVYLSHARKKRLPGIVHRLDREVSGLLVMAKHELARQRLADQFKSQKPSRKYLTLVSGVPEQPNGTIDTFLGTAKNLDRFVTKDETKGEPAKTHFRVVQKLADAALLELTLETSCRGQIRVHMSHLGAPILGDEKYGRGGEKHPKWSSSRLALHASELQFLHPKSGTPVTFSAPLPAVMQRFVNATHADNQGGQQTTYHKK